MKYVIFICFSLLLFTQCKSKSDGEIDKEKLPDDWKLVEVFPDEIPLLNEGGYYALYFHNDKPSDDEFLELTDEKVVALAVSDTNIVKKSKAYLFVNETTQELTLSKYEPVEKSSYVKVYANNLFQVTLDMKLHERIDGLDYEDMLVYAGTMTVLRKDLNQTQTFKVIGGI